MSDPALLSRTTARLSSVAGFIAFELSRYRQVTKVDPVDDFDLPSASLTLLGLCRVPRRDTFAADVTAIGNRAGLSTGEVANVLRAADSVVALASRHMADAGRPSTVGMLTAARDHIEEHTGFEELSFDELSLPGWLSQAVDRFWGAEEATATFPRDLYLPILLNLPVAIIEIDGLSVTSLNLWLQRHQLPALEATPNRSLRGCLTAYAGIGVLFLDRSDDPDEQRLTLAHEVGHFITDYLMPREDVARRRPDLLAVLDGDRAPTNTERFDALLADVPVGFHTHLLTRDARGGHLSSTSADVEDRTERLALELLAPLQSVLRETAATGPSDAQSVLCSRFGLPRRVAMRYANHIQRLRPRSPRSLLDAIGLAEDRTVSLGTEPDAHREPES